MNPLNIRLVIGLIFIVLMTGLVFAAQGQGIPQGPQDSSSQADIPQTIGGQVDEYGCLIAAGYSWNKTEQECVREWEQGEERYQNKGLEQIAKNRIRAGNYINEEGGEFRVSQTPENRIGIVSGGVEAGCDCILEQEQIKNKTRIKAILSNGNYSEIKIMPDTASETALNHLRLNICSEENNCSIKLKEVPVNEGVKLAYELMAEKNAKILGMFQTKMHVRVQVDAENGEVIQIEKPWWSLLSSESEE